MESLAVYVFIDASNLWAAQKSKGCVFDYQKLQQYLQVRFAPKTVRIFYYTAYPAEGTRLRSVKGKHGFYTFLKKGLGFTVRKKELKRITVHGERGDYVEEKGNMDVEMTIDALHHKDAYTEAVFFTGDSDFLALITYLRNDGKKVYVFSSRNNVSHELRTGSDGYIDVLDIEADIWGKGLAVRGYKKQ